MEIAFELLGILLVTPGGQIVAATVFILVCGAVAVSLKKEGTKKAQIESDNKRIASEEKRDEFQNKQFESQAETTRNQVDATNSVRDLVRQNTVVTTEQVNLLHSSMEQNRLFHAGSEAHHVAIRERVDEMAKIPELLEELSGRMDRMEKGFSEFKRSRESQDADRDAASRGLSGQMSELCDLFLQFSRDVKRIDNSGNDPLAPPDKDVVE